MILSGNRVLMADGTLKAVENIVVGDSVLDWKGATQQVEGISTEILYNPSREFVQIDNGITVSDDQTFLGKDTQFHSAADARRYWPFRLGYVGAHYQLMSDYNWGYNPDAVLPLVTGTVLASANNGSETVSSITPVAVPLETVMWSHRVSGSGTYVVEGLAVAAWPNAMWDWVNWQPLPITSTLTVIRRLDTGKIELHIDFDPTTVSYPYGTWSDTAHRFVGPTASPTGPTGGLTIVA